MSTLHHTGTSGIAGDFLVFPDAADIQNMFDGAGGTVTAWIEFASYGQGGFGRFVGKETWGFYTYGTLTRLGFFQATSGTTGIFTSPNGSLLINTPYFVCVRYDADVATAPTFSIDGVTVATTTVTGRTGTRTSDVGDRLIIGSNDAYDRAYDGRVSDVRLYPGRQLSDAEIMTMFVARGRDRIITNRARKISLSPLRHHQGIHSSWLGDTEQSVSNSSSLTVTTPTDEDGTLPLNGDILLMTVGHGGNSSGTPPNITQPTGWTQRAHFDLPSTTSTPAHAYYTKTSAGSEGVTFSVSSNQTGAIVAHPSLHRGLTEAPTNVATNTGTSSTPQSPTLAAPGANALIYRAMSHDGVTPQQSPTRGDQFPPDVRGRRILGDRNTHNGNTAAYGLELRANEAPGTRDWNNSVSDQWGALSASHLGGDGNEGLPGKDFSPALSHGESWHQVIGHEDTLRAGGW